jgi:hypothetical protein
MSRLSTGKDEHIWKSYGVASEAVFLIRPDGYIGFIGQPGTVPQVDQYLQAHAAPAPTTPAPTGPLA